jgi:hypothetical protein
MTRRLLISLGRATGGLGGLDNTVYYLATALLGSLGSVLGGWAAGLPGALVGLVAGGVVVMFLAALGRRLDPCPRPALPSKRLQALLDEASREDDA